MKNKLLGLLALVVGFGSVNARATDGLSALTSTVSGSISDVGTYATTALTIAAGVALIMVAIKYVRRAGK